MIHQAKVSSIDLSLSGNVEIGERENIDGYPTLLVFKHGERIAEYHGGRTHR